MKNITTQSTIVKLIFTFVLIGTIFLLFRVVFSAPDSIPSGDSAWELTMSVNVSSDENYPTVYMAVPFDSVSNRVIGQAFTHPGFELKRLTQRKDVAAREVIAIAREKGKLSLS